MFSWNFAKSAEAMFSRWAVKRLCKFLLKKKLGKFILGDIDLDQLDVQLTAGKIQLSDLAINVEYLNQKFGAAALVTVKEGSIGSLLVTMPWKGKGCEIEVDELELVLAPLGGNDTSVGSETRCPSQDGNPSTSEDPRKLGHEVVDGAGTSLSMDVHEGVKTIAKMVKWLLTSFHVKVKNMIIALDPSSFEEKHTGFCRTLVFRIAEAECGTCISQKGNLNADTLVDSFLGSSQLTNFIKFQGAVLEFLQMDGLDSNIFDPSATGTTSESSFAGCCPPNVMTPILTGEGSGFSGTLKLSIPWKQGSLDIRKVDADAYIDPLEIRLQPSSLKWFLHLWQIMKNTGKSNEDHLRNKASESVYYNAPSHCHSASFVSGIDEVPGNLGFSSVDLSSTMAKEVLPEALLTGSNFISDYVPFSLSRSRKNIGEEEPDFGASVDQFFECFDGIRNSQSALGDSGMWTWTCSVFSAITAASNLASGSFLIPSEQQHVETRLKAHMSGISIFFSLLDEVQKHWNGLRGEPINGSSNVHYVGAKCQGVSVVLQVCPRDVKLEAAVEHVELIDHFSHGNVVRDNVNADVGSQTVSIQQMQAAVQSALPLLPFSFDDADLEKTGGLVVTESPPTMFTIDKRCQRTNSGTIYRDDVVKAMLLRTSGVCQCQFTTHSSSSDDNVVGLTSFSLELPPFVFWLNFHLINMVLNLVEEVGKSSKIDRLSNDSALALKRENHSASSHGVVKSVSSSNTSSSANRNLKGDLFLPNARVILCFPYDKSEDLRSYSSWDQFIAFDFSSPSNLSEEKCQNAGLSPDASFHKGFASTASRILNLNMGNLDMYLITSISQDNAGSNSCAIQKQISCAQRVFSVNSGTSRFSRLSLLSQDSPVTGPWVAKRAKLLANSDASRNKSMQKGYEFASVNTVKDMEDFNVRTRREIIMSSSFFLHVHLPSVLVNISSFQYKTLHNLLLQMIDGLSGVPRDSVDVSEESLVSQTSFFVECDFLEISVSLEIAETLKASIQSELPGSWHSLKLNIQKFEFLNVLNIGGILGANFFWMAHGEGKLWGCTTGVQNEELLLISCSNSVARRGDGEGSNILSSRFSGSDIVNMWDPEFFHSYTSITIRCATIVAVGGRLDWLDALSSSFTSPSLENEQAGSNSLQKGNSEKRTHCGSSFVLNLVDIGLSYEPYNLVVEKALDSDCSSAYFKKEMGETHVACLLAASSLKLTNIMGVGCEERDYKIEVRDLGLLLCSVSASETVGGDTYSVEYLHDTGYVKVAREAHIEAIVRVNCENGLQWEVECSESHIFLETCHDTALGLIHLAVQLQQLYAPDVEESVVYLQNRWNNVQQLQETNVMKIFKGDSTPTESQVHNLNLDMKSEPGFTNLMDVISEDAFHLDGNIVSQLDSCDTQLHIALDDGDFREARNLRIGDPKTSSYDLSCYGSVGMEASQTSVSEKSFPEFIEGYFLSELCPLSELSLNNQSSIESVQCRSNVGRINGWYRDASLRIVDDHVVEVDKQTEQLRPLEAENPSNCITSESYVKPRGRVLLKNINVIWRLYAGLDWSDNQKNVQNSSRTCGRDTSVCLELVLSGMDIHYDVFPDGRLCVSRLSLSVQDFHLNDNSHDAPWKLVLGYYQSKDHPRESSSKAFKLELESVRPDPLAPLEEYRLQVAVLPMRLHLHQCQLDFLITFFGGKGSAIDQSLDPQDSGELNVQRLSSNVRGITINAEALLPYFQKFDMWPVVVRVDYSPSRVDLAALRGGKYVELVNLVPWKGVELRLKHVQATGVYGWGSVCETIIGEWLEDISQNQVHKLLQGLPPIRSLVAVGSGAAKLISLPVKSYKKDHRLLKGMQRGTIAFLRSISLEAIGLGVHLAAGAHDILLQAEYILTSSPPTVPWPIQSKMRTNVRSNQPKDVRHGMQQAYESISDGLEKSAAALVQNPLKRYQRGVGAGSALATAIKAAPAAAVAPASAAARAVHCALLGVRNSLDPEHKKESIEKYMGSTHPKEFT